MAERSGPRVTNLDGAMSSEHSVFLESSLDHDVPDMMVTRRADDRPKLCPLYQLQLEPSQNLWVLQHPDGMIKLNATTAEVLRRCDGSLSLNQLVEDLERDDAPARLHGDVRDVLGDAYGRGWIV